MTKDEIKAAKDAITIEVIRAECKADAEKKAWYNATVAQKVPCAVFPKGADGKADRTQQPTTVMRPITFVQLKAEFIKKYRPELIVKKEKKENMYTLL